MFFVLQERQRGGKVTLYMSENAAGLLRINTDALTFLSLLHWKVWLSCAHSGKKWIKTKNKQKKLKEKKMHKKKTATQVLSTSATSLLAASLLYRLKRNQEEGLFLTPRLYRRKTSHLTCHIPWWTDCHPNLKAGAQSKHLAIETCDMSFNTKMFCISHQLHVYTLSENGNPCLIRSVAA